MLLQDHRQNNVSIGSAAVAEGAAAKAAAKAVAKTAAKTAATKGVSAQGSAYLVFAMWILPAPHRR